MLPGADNRESGANPERSGHCKRRREITEPLRRTLREKAWFRRYSVSQETCWRVGEQLPKKAEFHRNETSVLLLK